MKLSLTEALNRYGKIEGGVWPQEDPWCLLMAIQPEIGGAWINSANGHPVTHIYLNRDMVEPLRDAFHRLIDRCLVPELKTFDGCFQIRDVRGMPGHVSTHSYGLAIDINAQENQLGGASSLSPGLVDCFKGAGFLWGGDFSRSDPMHFQYALW